MTSTDKTQCSNADMLARYQRADTLDRGIPLRSRKSVAFNTTLYPHWVGSTDTFWYVRDARIGHSFRLVDAKAGTSSPAFDHDKLSAALASASGEELLADDLPISALDLSNVPEKVTFSGFGKRWTYHRASETCAVLHDIEDIKISPDGKYALFSRDYNLWVRELTTGQERALTEDGERFYVYACTPAVWGYQWPLELDAQWSPDSKRVFTQVIDTRKVGVAMPLVDHVPEDGSLRPRLVNPDRRVAFPGDEHVDVYRFLSIEVDNGSVQFAQTADCPITFMPYIGYMAGFRAWWDQDNRHTYFVEEERGMKAHRLQRFDTHTGTVKTLIEETSDFHTMLIPSTHTTPLFMALPETNEVIWYSERSGTAHFYLYDTITGELKNTITQGHWIVRNGLSVDAKRRELTLQTASRIEGRNPYYCDICRVNIDTGELTTLLSTDHEYMVCDQRSRMCNDRGDASKYALGVAPSGDYIVTTRSRVDEVPVSLLLDREGKEVMVLETADVSGLPENCTWPEPVMLKADDGETDIYSVVFRPSNFDPNKSYPVIDCTVNYATPVGSFTCNNTYLYLRIWAYAELGFIVVVVFNRGTERLRDKAFNEYTDPAFPVDPPHMLSQYNNDSVAGIKQLAERYPYMDLNRVGVAEFGHTPRAMSGMLLHPDFYKVGVCVNTDGDRRIMSSQGLDFRGRDVLQFEDLAENLNGKLLLVAHMLDPFAPVSGTFRMVSAFHKANKRFDMLILPEAGHSLLGHTLLRCWDYFVEHLLGEEPPKNFTMKTDKIAKFEFEE